MHRSGFIREISSTRQTSRDTTRGVGSFPLYVYDFVVDLCMKLGASREEFVPFKKYASGAMSLARPASVARALASGAVNVERANNLRNSWRSRKAQAIRSSIKS